MTRSSSKRSRHETSPSRSRSISQSSSSSSSTSSESSSCPTSSSSSSSHSSSSSTSSSSSSSSSRSANSRGERNARSQSPVTKIQINRLTKNVNKNHIIEIFKSYGQIKNVELSYDKWHPTLSKGSALVDFEKTSDAEKAIKFMDGGQIDGQVITVSKSYGNENSISTNSSGNRSNQSRSAASSFKNSRGPSQPPHRNNGHWRRNI